MTKLERNIEISDAIDGVNQLTGALVGILKQYNKLSDTDILKALSKVDEISKEISTKLHSAAHKEEEL